ncbi:MAG TPA: TrkA C-terminal domain-containing protein [Dehalococcoidia bacterium]|nr:TrkA C-terminal domain-containing protein [Dehalococcoidia bacterium]
MAYVGILLIAILVSFIVVRIGGFALQLTGIEPDVARFQALSAFSGTGFTTREAERVVGNRTRRRIVTILIILGNAGMVTVIATLVASFTQVSGYAWFFIRLAIIIGGIFGLYQLIIRSNFGRRIPAWLQRPVMNRILKEAPAAEEIFHVEKDWAISLVMIKGSSNIIGLSVTDITAEEDIEVLAIDRAGTYLTRPNWDEKIAEGDRLLVYANRKSVKRILG